MKISSAVSRRIWRRGRSNNTIWRGVEGGTEGTETSLNMCLYLEAGYPSIHEWMNEWGLFHLILLEPGFKFYIELSIEKPIEFQTG